MKYAHIKLSGELLGWYDTEVHTSIPDPNVEVSEMNYELALLGNHNYISLVDGSTELKDLRTEAVKQEDLNSINKAYLVSTDWYSLRLLEEGIAIPLDIIERRKLARRVIL
jgi:hypothetical protein